MADKIPKASDNPHPAGSARAKIWERKRIKKLHERGLKKRDERRRAKQAEEEGGLPTDVFNRRKLIEEAVERAQKNRE